jgi:hypothetical protein
MHAHAAMRIRDLRAYVLVLVLCGCVHLDAEPVGSGSGSNETAAKTMFDSQVYPILVNECGDCHATTPGNPYGFVSTTLSTAYETVMSYQGLMGDFTPTGTPLLTDDDMFHPNQFTPNELMVIDDWLAEERSERGL